MQDLSGKIVRSFIVDLVLLAVLLLAAFFVQSCGKDKTSVREVSESAGCDVYEKCIAITFDDGPHGKDTERLLDELKKRNVRATFFLIGENIEQSDLNRSLVDRMHNEGHLIGNHTYTHINIKTIGRNAALQDIN